MLRAGNDLEELFKLRFRGRGRGGFVQIAEQGAEILELALFGPNIDAEEADQDDEAGGQGFGADWERSRRAPGYEGESDGECHEQKEAIAPQGALRALEPLPFVGDALLRIGR